MPQYRTRKGAQAANAHLAPTPEAGIFQHTDPKRIAELLTKSVEHGERTATSFRAAMARLNVYIDRAGDSLSATQRRRLEAAKGELRTLFNRRERTVH